MFKKLNFKINDQLIKKINYLSKFIDKGSVLYRDDTIDFKFKKYPKDTDEDKLFQQYADKYTIYKQVDFAYSPILSVIPKSLLDLEVPKIHWQVFDGGSLVPPHIDKGRISTINLYTQVNGEKTVVYSKLRNGARLETENGIITNESFIPEWIVETGSFVANQWDFYLLNVSRPHAVINMTSNRRISISFSFYKTAFENIMDACNVQETEV